MAHKTLIGGTAYDISGGKTLIGGTAYSIAGGKTLIGGTSYDISFATTTDSSSFASADWEDVIAICQSGEIPDTWAVGDQKTLTIDGVDYTIDIVGMYADAYYDTGEYAPITFQFHDCIARSGMNSSATNSGGWGSSYIRSTLLPDLLSAFPTAVQEAIRPVLKITGVGSGSSSLEATEDSLFLPSVFEITGAATYTASGEGMGQYEYYATESARKAYYTSTTTAVPYWTRSPATGSTANFASISTGGAVQALTATTSIYVAPAFCF